MKILQKFMKHYLPKRKHTDTTSLQKIRETLNALYNTTMADYYGRHIERLTGKIEIAKNKQRRKLESHITNRSIEVWKRIGSDGK